MYFYLALAIVAAAWWLFARKKWSVWIRDERCPVTASCDQRCAVTGGSSALSLMCGDVWRGWATAALAILAGPTPTRQTTGRSSVSLATTPRRCRVRRTARCAVCVGLDSAVHPCMLARQACGGGAFKNSLNPCASGTLLARPHPAFCAPCARCQLCRPWSRCKRSRWSRQRVRQRSQRCPGGVQRR